MTHCVRVLPMLVALLLLGNGGCLWLAAGTAAGLCCHRYCQGKVCHTYVADLGDAWAATKSALADLGMNVEKEESGPTKAFLKSRTADGSRVRIYLERGHSQIPADGPVTRICVRVATFGDYVVSDRLLYQIGAHLVSAPPLVPLQPAPVSEPALAPAPRTVEPPPAR